jgi:3-hydroxyacyl-CoA dehydrogenase/enoyl-CoA hydratase/3-hydroxybutyryl-CoA epimerase
MSLATPEAAWRWEGGAEGIRTLWFDQPGGSHNVLDACTLDELEARLVEVENDGSVRGLLIRSAKPAGFCAGADLKRILTCRTPAEAEAYLRHGLAVLEHLSALAVPTVAVIHGACLGGGLELALACRRRAALASAAPLRVGTPEVHFGLIPGWGAITRLPRIVGPEDGLNLLITGRSIGYLLARSHGIVDRLASDGDSIESLDLLASAPAPERTWPKESWEEAWHRAREKIDEQPGDHPEAQLQVLTIVAIDLAHGREAAREATVTALAELAMSDVVRESLAAFLERGRGETGG